VDKILDRLDALSFGVYMMMLGIFGAISIKVAKLVGSFCQWVGRQAFLAGIEVARDALIKAPMQEFTERLDKIDASVAILAENLGNYRMMKHNHEGELAELIDVIIDPDDEKMEVLKTHYLQKKNKK